MAARVGVAKLSEIPLGTTRRVTDVLPLRTYEVEATGDSISLQARE